MTHAPGFKRRRFGAADAAEDQVVLEVGFASVSLLERTVTKAERDAWRCEDAERDRRRIQPGFRLPGT